MRLTPENLSEPGSFSLRASLLTPASDGDADLDADGTDNETTTDGDATDTTDSDLVADGDGMDASDSDVLAENDATDNKDSDTTADGDATDATDGDATPDGDTNDSGEKDAFDGEVPTPSQPGSSGGCNENGNGASWLLLAGLGLLALRRAHGARVLAGQHSKTNREAARPPDFHLRRDSAAC